MVSSSSSCISIAATVLMSFLVILTVATTSSYASSKHKDVCANSKYLCEVFTDPTPVLKSLLQSLTQNSIDFAYSEATSMRQQITKWQEEADLSLFKKLYGICMKAYEKAIAALDESKQKIRSGNYSVSHEADEAYNMFMACRDQFYDKADPTPLASTTLDLSTVSHIIFTLSKIREETYA